MVTPVNVIFPASQLTLCLVLMKTGAEQTVKEFLKTTESPLSDEKTFGVVIYVGPSAPWERLQFLKTSKFHKRVYWSRDRPTFSHSNEIQPTSALVALRGCKVLQEVTPIPTDLKGFVAELRVANDGLATLAQKLEVGDTAEIIAAYYEAKKTYSELNQAGIQHLLSLLGARLGMDLLPATLWFKTPIAGVDRSDILDPADVSFRDFLRRLKRYCKEAVLAKPSTSEDLENQLSMAKNRIVTCESQIKALTATVAKQDRTISQLQEKLESAESLIKELRDMRNHSKTLPIRGSHSHVSSSTEPLGSQMIEDSLSWQDDASHFIRASKTPTSQELNPTLPLPDKSKAQTLQIWQKADSESPKIRIKRPRNSPVLMLNSRPQLALIYEKQQQASSLLRKDISKMQARGNIFQGKGDQRALRHVGKMALGRLPGIDAGVIIRE